MIGYTCSRSSAAQLMLHKNVLLSFRFCMSVFFYTHLNLALIWIHNTGSSAAPGGLSVSCSKATNTFHWGVIYIFFKPTSSQLIISTPLSRAMAVLVAIARPLLLPPTSKVSNSSCLSWMHWDMRASVLSFAHHPPFPNTPSGTPWHADAEEAMSDGGLSTHTCWSVLTYQMSSANYHSS